MKASDLLLKCHACPDYKKCWQYEYPFKKPGVSNELIKISYWNMILNLLKARPKTLKEFMALYLMLTFRALQEEFRENEELLHDRVSTATALIEGLSGCTNQGWKCPKEMDYEAWDQFTAKCAGE